MIVCRNYSRRNSYTCPSSKDRRSRLSLASLSIGNYTNPLGHGLDFPPPPQICLWASAQWYRARPRRSICWVNAIAVNQRSTENPISASIARSHQAARRRAAAACTEFVSRSQSHERISRKSACSSQAATRPSGHARNARHSFSGRVRGSDALCWARNIHSDRDCDFR